MITRSFPYGVPLPKKPLQNESLRWHAGEIVTALVKYKIDRTELWAEIPVKQFRLLGYGPTEQAAIQMAERNQQKSHDKNSIH